ncbi:MAG TPA: hypothetical protein VMH39_08960 [Gemmatimonadaceae bacterium]|nr:hypothetical protein [Gemmatimonadaceae bacterium]
MQVTLGLSSSGIAHGRVQPELQYLPEPAVDSGFTYEIGTDYYERPIALAFTLVTDSNAATRQVALKLETPTGLTLAAVPIASGQTASLTYTYSFLAQLSNAQAVEATVVMSPLFNFVIPSLYSLVVTIANKQAGDQISNICWYSDRFSTGPDGYPMGGYSDDSLAAWAVSAASQE